MEFDFRFFALCEIYDGDNGVDTLANIINAIGFEDSELPCDINMVAAVGCVLVPEMHGKRLDLMAWQLDGNGHRQGVAGYKGTHLIIPPLVGAKVCTTPITLPILTAGYYGFDLWDREGAFGKKPDLSGNDPGAGLLATYLFAVFGPDKRPTHLR